MGYLNAEEIRELLERPLVSFLTTLRPDGTPHVTPVWHVTDDDEVVIAVDRRTVKARNVRVNPNVALCVAADASPQPWLLLDGNARLSEENVERTVRAICAHYLEPEELDQYVEEALRIRDFALIRITPRRITGFDGLD